MDFFNRAKCVSILSLFCLPSINVFELVANRGHEVSWIHKQVILADPTHACMLHPLFCKSPASFLRGTQLQAVVHGNVLLPIHRESAPTWVR